jgi:chemotaxis protein MotB
MENNQPIIVKRVKKVMAGAHGGAWKIAFADFATAMMAFFLVMWLMSSATPEQRRLISGYFKDPVGFSSSASPYVIDLGGTPTPSPERTLNPEPESALDPRIDSDGQVGEAVEQERLELLLQELQTLQGSDSL